MPKNKFQDVIFTIIMATIMVYGMVVYNVALKYRQAYQEQTFLSCYFTNCRLWYQSHLF